MVVRRQLKRGYVLAFFEKLAPCLIGIEACASSHHWSRQLQALGHTVRLMPPAYVKPYVKRQKNDATDAEAICEAVSRANMRFVPNTWLHRPSLRREDTPCQLKAVHTWPQGHRILARASAFQAVTAKQHRPEICVTPVLPHIGRDSDITVVAKWGDSMRNRAISRGHLPQAK